MKFFVILLICSVGESSDLPKVKRLEESKSIKNYVEGSHKANQHQHPNPLLGSEARNVKEQNYGFEDPLYGEAEAYSSPGARHDSTLTPVRRVEDTKVDCRKNYMVVYFRFSAPFNGYVYPYEHFAKCILFTGQNSNEVTLTLHHGECGEKEIQNANNPEFSAIIEHRLMIQWEKDFMCEDDSSVIVRCDRPDDFNKTIAWNFETLELSSTFERNTHPGPKMWMEIQKGEGPNAPPLDDKPVYIGDVLTLVFTLSDDVFWFGSNILACTAVDGGDHEGLYGPGRYASVNPYTGRMTVIEEECSTKPKVFSHFYKERITKDGNLVTLHYAHFKAFRFPTSQKVIIQCDVQVCYKKCESLPPCSVGFQPRAAKSRSRRSLAINDTRNIEEGSELDTVLLYRTIEVFSAEDGALREIPVKTRLSDPETLIQEMSDYCYSAQTFFSWVSIFAVCSILLLAALVWNLRKSKPKLFETPTKN